MHLHEISTAIISRFSHQARLLFLLALAVAKRQLLQEKLDFNQKCETAVRDLEIKAKKVSQGRERVEIYSSKYSVVSIWFVCFKPFSRSITLINVHFIALIWYTRIIVQFCQEATLSLAAHAERVAQENAQLRQQLATLLQTNKTLLERETKLKSQNKVTYILLWFACVMLCAFLRAYFLASVEFSSQLLLLACSSSAYPTYYRISQPIEQHVVALFV